MSIEREELSEVLAPIFYADPEDGDMFRHSQNRDTLIDAILASGYRKVT